MTYLLAVPASTSRRALTHGAIAAALLFTTVAGCGAADRPRPEGAGQGQAYLLGTRVWDDSSTTSYFHVVPSLESGTLIDKTRALEVPGAAKLYAVPNLGWFGIGGGEAPTITRYTLSDDGRMVRGQSISLQSFGITSLWDTLYVVSPTKAYYPDRAGHRLIIWNPTTMEVTGSVSLNETARPGYLALYGYAPIMRGNELLISVGWFDWEENDDVRGETGLLRLDTVTDAVLAFETDDRCGGVTQPVTVASGDTYLVSGALGGAAYRLGRLARKPCALRVGAAATGFDAGYLVELEAVTGAAISGEPIPAGGNGIFLRTFDESLAAVEADSATYELTGQSAWHWVRWDVVGGTVSPVAGLPPSTADVLWFTVGDHVYGSETTPDYAQTTLIDLTAEGGPRRELTAPGFLHSVARIR